MTKVLVIDPERSIRNILKERLEYEGFYVETADSGMQAVEVVARVHCDIVIIDGKLQQESKVLLSTIKGLTPSAKVIVISSQSDVESAVNYIRSGAYDFISKPIDFGKLLSTIRCAEKVSPEQNIIINVNEQQSCSSSSVSDHEHDNDSAEIIHPHCSLEHRSRKRPVAVEPIVGNSPIISHVKLLIDKVAPSDARVLISGANGTGKELVARWLHEKSNRCHGPFVEVNCAAIPSELIESELFGHEKGAFTSAIKQRKGKFEQADGGTLFLDEIGDMSLSAQAKVLRALQENKISRVGSDKDIDVNVRVIAATNKNLQHEIQACNFREDLYHRLSVIVLKVPPLSDRKDDIPMLVDYFIGKICAEYSIPIKKIDPQATEFMKDMPWTGNIRELRNVIERLIILSEKDITLNDVNDYAVGLV